MLALVVLTSLVLPGQTLAGQDLERSLNELEQGQRERVAIGVFGASHIEAQKLTNRLRSRLGDRVGRRGQGFIDPKPTRKMLRSHHIRRKVRGDHEWMNGHRVAQGEPMSLSGHKLRLGVGATATLKLCAGCTKRSHDDEGYIEVAWLDAGGTGQLIIDDVIIGDLAPQPASKVPAPGLGQSGPSSEAPTVVRRLRARVRGDRHLVEIKNIGASGDLEILSVVAESERAGVVVDALGLSGATGERFARFEQSVLADQARARRYDFVVFAWGTNEVGKRAFDAVRYEKRLRGVMRTVLDASPGAGCAYFGPTDRLVRRRAGWKPAPQHERVVAVQQRLAGEFGCVYFDAAAEMGGQGSVNRWRRRGWALEDRTHLTRVGYRRLADRFLARLLPTSTSSSLSE